MPNKASQRAVRVSRLSAIDKRASPPSLYHASPLEDHDGTMVDSEVQWADSRVHPFRRHTWASYRLSGTEISLVGSYQ